MDELECKIDQIHERKSQSVSEDKMKQGLLSLTAQRAACDATSRRVIKRASFLLGSVLLGQNFTGMGSSPAEMFDTVRQVVDRATTLPLEVFRQ